MCSNISAVTDDLVFEWDARKNLANRRKHDVSFEMATLVFEDPHALMIHDRMHEGEERWQAIGRSGAHTVLVVAHVVRTRGEQEVVRIISARYALTHERQRYASKTR